MKKPALATILFLLTSFCAFAQTVYTVGPGGDVDNLHDAFETINNSSDELGDLEFQIIGNIEEPAPVVLFQSGYNGVGSYSSIKIYPTAPGLTISGDFNLPLIHLNNADNITFDGRVNQMGDADLTIVNTSPDPVPTIMFSESATNNVLQYCIIKGAGNIIEFSTSSNDVETGNNYNQVLNCKISGGTARASSAIYSSGSSGRLNKGLTISNNEIYDIFKPGASGKGIYLGEYTTECTISGNSFYETTPFTATANVAFRALEINTTSGSGFTVSDNYIGGSAVQCGGAAWTKTGSDTPFSGISINAASDLTTSVQNNVVRNFSWANTGSSTWSGIEIQGGKINLGTETGNIIGGSIAFTGSTLTGIMINGTVFSDCRQNRISGLSNLAATGQAIGLYVFTFATTPFNIDGNFINDLSSSSLTSGIIINIGGGTLSNNILSLGGNNSSYIYGICDFDGEANTNFYYNTIRIAGTNAGSLTSSSLRIDNSTGLKEIKNNILNNARSGGGAKYGLYIENISAGVKCDYNDYHTPGGTLGYYGADKTVLPVVTSQDANSLNTDPLFSAPGGSSPEDFIPAATITGVSLPAVPLDFNGSARSLTVPFMGAFEVSTCADPVNAGTISSVQSGCAPFNPAALSGTAASGHTGTLEYKWQLSVTGSTEGFTDISSSNSLSFDPGSLSQTTWYRRLARVTCSSDWSGAATSNVIEITVNPAPTAEITGELDACLLTTLTAVTDAPSATYTWFKDFAIIKIGESNTIDVITSDKYKVMVKNTTTNCEQTSPFSTVTITALPSATISGNTTGCDAVLLTAGSDAASPSYTWYKDNVEISGAAASTYTATSSGSYKVKVINGATSCENFSATKVVTVYSTPSSDLNVTGSGTICSGTSTAINVELSQSGVNYQLRNAAGNINIGSPVAGNGGTIALPTGNLTATTTFNILATTAGSGCSVQLTGTATVTVDPVSAGGTLSGGAAAITYGEPTGTMTLTGHTGDIIMWQKRYNSGAWTDISNTASTYSETPSSAGTWKYRVRVRSGVCPDAFSTESITTVAKKDLTITATDESKTYGTLFTFTGDEFTTSGLTGSDAVTGLTLTSTGSPENSDLSSSPYTITPSAATGTGLDNYNIIYVNGSLTVNPASLTITASDLSKTYGNALSFAGNEFTFAGLQSWDVISSVSLTSEGSTAEAAVAGSPYSIIPSGATGTGLSNYTITYENGSLTVNKAPLSITANNRSKTYGQYVTLVGTEYTVTGLLFNDAVTSVTLTSAGTVPTAGVSGSPYSIVPSDATGTGLENYQAEYINGSLTVNKASLTVTADDKTRKYDEPNPQLTISFSGFVNNDGHPVINQLPSAATTATQTSVTGSYPVTVSGGSDDNYSFNYVSGTLTITKQQQTITITDAPDELQAGSSYTLGASSTSGLTVSFESLDSDLATISGNTVTGVRKGEVTIRAFNQGTENYDPAEAFTEIKIISSHRDILNLFTPNGDGFNDYWELPLMSEWGRCDVRVFNRWGKLVFSNPDYDNMWDGTSNGSRLPEGPYYFIVETENAGIVKGTVNLVR